MSSMLPARPRKPRLSAQSVLKTVIEIQGAELFSAVLREKTTGSAPPEVPPLEWKSLLSAVQSLREDGIGATAQHAIVRARGFSQTLSTKARQMPSRLERELQRTRAEVEALESLSRKAQYLGLRVLRPASYLGGVLLGIQLPALDIRFRKESKSLDTITLHSVPLIGVDVTLEWIRRVLSVTASAPDLNESDRKILQGLERAVGDYQQGAVRGAGARRAIGSARRLKSLQRSVSLTSQSFQRIETVLRELSSERRKRS